MNWRDRITFDQSVLVGKPVIRGTRVAVEFLVELLAEGWTHADILRNYPHLTEEDILAALHYVAERASVFGAGRGSLTILRDDDEHLKDFQEYVE